jgi:SAM-dependent methyltransferase
MNTVLLERDAVLAAYDEVARLYPHIPPLAAWRAWELAGYRRYQLAERVLDVGCGDGRYFRLAWPNVHDVVGVDIDPDTAARASQTGIYREVHVAPADRLPFAPKSFGSAFANCALEHMDELPVVLRVIRPGGVFLCSVATDKFLKWAVLPILMRLLGDDARASALQRQHDTYHHHVNLFPADVWQRHFSDAGFEIVEHVPIVPEVTARAQVMLDQLWHLPSGDHELGLDLHHYFQTLPDFHDGLRRMLDGLLTMEKDRTVGGGAIFLMRRPA